jgi:hypothetical protein
MGAAIKKEMKPKDQAYPKYPRKKSQSTLGFPLNCFLKAIHIPTNAIKQKDKRNLTAITKENNFCK